MRSKNSLVKSVAKTNKQKNTYRCYRSQRSNPQNCLKGCRFPHKYHPHSRSHGGLKYLLHFHPKNRKKLPQEHRLCNVRGLRRMECTPTPFLNGIQIEDASFLAKKRCKSSKNIQRRTQRRKNVTGHPIIIFSGHEKT